ncbi:MAG: exodeoxyribonuclease VII large subunit [Candidatus Lambdaproteobacteria bacterium]|nr:exodeoxyribonuclease VII large subunit [Candidatus Lambdaproteobacteria bacterium]
MRDIPFTVEVEEPSAQVAQRPAPSGAAEGPAGAPAAKAPGPAALAKPLTVAELTRHIRQLLEEQFQTVTVEGEVSNARRPGSGHLYFQLKDESAQIRCVMFRNAAQSLRFELEDGMQVRVRARLTVYEARGEYQLQVLTLDPQGTGALQIAFEQLKRRLEAEGLFARERKRALPYLPRRIGIVTSPTGAAVRDILHVLQRRFPGMPVLIHPARVQGEGAAEEVAEGIAVLNRLAAAQKIDVIIVGRGGGSIEDLWAFNEEVVARAIHASRVPIVSAVGHEVDFTIADFVADVRAPTPSAAAEIVVPPKAELLNTVIAFRGQLGRRFAEGLKRRVERREGLRARLGAPESAIRQTRLRAADLRERLDAAGALRLARGHERLAQARGKLHALRPDRLTPMHRTAARSLHRRLGPALRRHVARLRERLDAQAGLLDSLSPLTVLKRGYGVVLDAAGRALTTIRGVAPGDALRVRLQDGTLDAEVNQVHPKPPDRSP